MKNETMNSLELCFNILFTIIGLLSLMSSGVSGYPGNPIDVGAVFGGTCFIFVAFLIISYLIRNF
jgi:hypothetical protein